MGRGFANPLTKLPAKILHKMPSVHSLKKQHTAEVEVGKERATQITTERKMVRH